MKKVTLPVVPYLYSSWRSSDQPLRLRRKVGDTAYFLATSYVLLRILRRTYDRTLTERQVCFWTSVLGSLWRIAARHTRA